MTILTKKIKIYPNPRQTQQLEAIERATWYMFRRATETKQQEYQELLAKYGVEVECQSLEYFSQVVEILHENAKEEKSTLPNVKKYHVRKKSVYRHWGILVSSIPETLDFSTSRPIDDYYTFRNPKQYNEFREEFKNVLDKLTFTTRRVQKIKKRG